VLDDSFHFGHFAYAVLYSRMEVGPLQMAGVKGLVSVATLIPAEKLHPFLLT
jgi:hypothetical protein